MGVAAALMLHAGLVLGAGRAGAIAFGQPDDNLHPNVGALVADWDPDSPGPDVLCSGTLIAPTVYLTAAHCTAFLESEGITQAWVTFAADYDEDAAAPAELPTAGLLDQTFTAVGYGTVREEKTGGPHGFLDADGVRMYALQSALNLEKAWLLLSMNPSTGSGGPATATPAARTSSAAWTATWSSPSPSPATRCAGPPTRPTGSTRPPPGSSSPGSSHFPEPARDPRRATPRVQHG